jgi:hypothetical protein
VAQDEQGEASATSGQRNSGISEMSVVSRALSSDICLSNCKSM